MNIRPEEPRITDEDQRQYDAWLEECELWAQTRTHRRRVSRAKKLASEMMESCDRPYISWSAGKDSTALVYLLCVDIGLDVPVMSLVTDIEPPNTEVYMRQLAGRWSLSFEVIRPEISFLGWLETHADDVDLYDSITGTGGALANVWDETIGKWRQKCGYNGCYWGLRRDESRGREINYRSRGVNYQTSAGLWRSAPLIHWEARDVFGYCANHGVELMDLYKCVRLVDDPGRVRKSMLLPDDKGGQSHDQGIWLRTYYPSVFEKFKSILPQIQALT